MITVDSISKYYFSLNPSLKVIKYHPGEEILTSKRINHIIEINPGKVLNPGESDNVEFVYSGPSTNSFCYPD